MSQIVPQIVIVRHGTGRTTEERVPIDEDGASGVSSRSNTTRQNNIVEESSDASVCHSPRTIRTRNETSKRKKWTTDMNTFIMREFYRITKNEKDMSNYRTQLHEAFTSKYPNFKVSIQNLADQRRAIVKKKYLPIALLEQIKCQLNNISQIEENDRISVASNDSTSNTNHDNTAHNTNLNNIDDANETTNTNFQTENNSTPNTNTQTNDEFNFITNNFWEYNNNLYNTTEQFKTVNNFEFHINFQKEIETEFCNAYSKYSNIHPFDRPSIPKQSISQKFLATVSILDKYILPQFVEKISEFKELHSIIYCGAIAAIRINNSKETSSIKPKNKLTTPPWETRLTNKVNDIRRELGQITQYLRGVNTNHIQNCIAKIAEKNNIHCDTYNEYNNSITQVKNTLQQKLTLYSERLRKYRRSQQRKSQNKQFIKNEKSFYRNLNTNTNINTNNGFPHIKDLTSYWSSLWTDQCQFNTNARWIKSIENKLEHVNPMPDEDSEITLDTLINAITKTHNWKSPGKDKIHNFWIKKFTCTHKHLLTHFNNFIKEPINFPSFLSSGITYLKPKDCDTKNPSKYRPITCLTTLYKILTSCITEIIYNHCISSQILNEEQKGCIKNSFGCKEQLIIDSIIMEQAKKENRNIYTSFIDYKKAYDSVPHSWLTKILEIYKIHPTLVTFLKCCMAHWQTTLNLHHEDTHLQSEPIRIKRGIFQGDSLSPLWFCLAVNPLSDVLNSTKFGFNIRINKKTESTLNHLLYMDDIKLYGSTKNQLTCLIDLTEQFSKDIGMSFGIDKCKTQSITRGVHEALPHITNTNEIIQNLEVGEVYKYLGFQQSKHIQHTAIKDTLKNQFSARVKSILKTELNGKNLIKAINTYAIPLLTYSFGIIKWTNTDINNILIKTRTLFTKFRKHHPKSAVERFTLPRSSGGRGVLDIHNLHNKQIAILKNYFLKKSDSNTLFNALVRVDKNYTPLNLSDKQKIRTDTQNITNKIQLIKQKTLHGRHFTQLDQPDINKEYSNIWLTKSDIYPETEGFIFAIQDQVINTKNYRKHIIKDSSIINDRCRLCKKESETIQHITSSCGVLAQGDYKSRHDSFAKIIHQQLAFNLNLIQNTGPCHTYTPEPFLENNEHELYWDRTVLTDTRLKANRPDIILINKQVKEAYLIDIAVPSSHNINATYQHKINKYLDLSLKIKSSMNLSKISILPLVISVTGLVPKTLIENLKILKLKKSLIIKIQKAVLLGTCHIVRKFLGQSDTKEDRSELGQIRSEIRLGRTSGVAKVW